MEEILRFFKVNFKNEKIEAHFKTILNGDDTGESRLV